MAICREVEAELSNANIEYLDKLQELENEFIDKVVGNLGLENDIKSKVVGALGAKLLESRSGQVSLYKTNAGLNEAVEVRFTYK